MKDIKYRCPECGQQFDTKEELIEHQTQENASPKYVGEYLATGKTIIEAVQKAIEAADLPFKDKKYLLKSIDDEFAKDLNEKSRAFIYPYYVFEIEEDKKTIKMVALKILIEAPF